MAYKNYDMLSLQQKINEVDNKAEKKYVEDNINKINSSLEEKASKTDIANISSGTPLFASSTTEMTDTTKNYVNLTDGYLYTYNSTSGAFEKSTVQYQATGLSDKSITLEKLNDEVKLNNFPFQRDANFKFYNNNIATVMLNAIKNIEIYNTDDTVLYSVCVFRKNVDSKHAINIFTCNADGTYKDSYCYWNKTNYTEPSGVDEISLIANSDNKTVVAKIWVDWSVVPDATNYHSLGYTSTGIDINCIRKENNLSMVAVDVYNRLAPPIFEKAKNLSIAEGIKNITLYNTDKNCKYYLRNITRDYKWGSNTQNTWTIIINSKNLLTNEITTACKIDVLGLTEVTPIQTLTLESATGSSVSGSITLDWGIVAEGTVNLFDEDDYVISSLVDKTTSQKIKTVLPPKLYAVKGLETALYYDNLSYGNENIFWTFSSSLGRDLGVKQEERFKILPTTTGTTTLTAKVFDETDIYYTQLYLMNISVSIADTADATGTKKCMFIGDSLTNFGKYTEYLLNLSTNDVMKIQLVGTRGIGDNKHEGRAGWGSYDYIATDSFNGSTNAFYNPDTKTFDFSYYMANNSVDVPDWIFIQLGTNDTWRPLGGHTTAENIETLITSIHAYNSSIKVGVALIPLCAKAKTTVNYKRVLLEFSQQSIDKFANREEEGIYLVPLHVNIDTVNNFPKELVNVNSRNADTQMYRITDDTHPNNSGYGQIADSYWAFLKNN